MKVLYVDNKETRLEQMKVYREHNREKLNENQRAKRLLIKQEKLNASSLTSSDESIDV